MRQQESLIIQNWKLVTCNWIPTKLIQLIPKRTKYFHKLIHMNEMIWYRVPYNFLRNCGIEFFAPLINLLDNQFALKFGSLFWNFLEIPRFPRSENKKEKRMTQKVVEGNCKINERSKFIERNFKSKMLNSFRLRQPRILSMEEKQRI